VGPPSERGVEREFDRTDTREYYREDYRDGPGDRVEYVRRRLPFYAIMIGAATVLSSVSVIMFSSGTSLVQADTISLRAVFGVSIIQGILAVMFVLFAGSIGSGTVRQRAARATTGGGVSAEASAGKTSVLIGLIGTVGTVVAAVLAFLGVLFQVYGGGG